MSKKEPQVLEAVTSMARIATLAFHPEGSKIAFRNHTIVICPPSASDSLFNLIPKSLLQGIDRYMNSDSRNDLHILNHVIKNFIDYYVTPYRQKDPVTHRNLINLTKYTCVGLMKLQRTYSDEQCNASLVIQLYINILRDLIRNEHDPSSFYIPNGKQTKPVIVDTDDLSLSTIFDTEKLKTYWSQNELNRLCEQFNGCFRNHGEIEDFIFAPANLSNDEFNSILNLGAKTDKVSSKFDASKNANDIDPTSSLIDISLPPQPSSPSSPSSPSMTTQSPTASSIGSGTYQEGLNKFALPEPSNQNLPIVKGLVVSIMEILDRMDERFTVVLSQSLQGISK